MTFYSDEYAKAALARAEARKVVIAGNTTHYWFYAANQTEAETLVLIHGYRGNHHGLEAIAGALPDFNIVIPDLPGFGQSSPLSGKHTMGAYVVWLGTFVRVISSDLASKPVLIGHSFGSIVSAAFAAVGEDKDKISHLVLINPVSSPALKGSKALLTKFVRIMLWLSGILPLKTGLALLKSWPMVRGMSIVMTKSKNRELRHWVHAQHDGNFNDFANRQVAIECYNASISHNVSEYAADFKVPTTLIIGVKDEITSVKQQERMAATIPTDWSLTTLMGVGHLTHYEQPNAVASAIRVRLQKNVTVFEELRPDGEDTR